MKALNGVVVLAGCLMMLACQRNREEQQGAIADTASAGRAELTGPDTTGEALWARLHQDDYRAWPLWPGKEKYYVGQEPHGALLVTYVNALAQDALTNGASQMPAGAIIVKENYAPDSTLMATTVMEKVAGYDASNSDWFWAKYKADGTVEMAGRAEMCYSCHKGASQYDQLWTLAKEKTGKGPPPMRMP